LNQSKIIYSADVDGVKKMIETPGISVVVTHRNPDGDAIGSSIALYHLLVAKGHTVHLLLPSEYPVVFTRFLNDISVKIYDLNQDEVRAVIRSANFIFALDFNALDRIDKVGEIIHDLPTSEIAVIDHHLDPEPFAKWIISDTSSSSTCELLFDVLVQAGYMKDIDLRIAELLLLGILTDTGCFSYSVSPELFRKSAQLIEKGIAYKELVDEIFNSWDVKYMKLLGHCLANRMEIIDELQTGIIYLTKEDFQNHSIQRGDTEGIVNYLLKLKSVKIAVLITEQASIIKFSFRSKGDLSVADLARKYFKGGGHKNASGGSMYGTIESAIQRFKFSIKEHFKYVFQS
jgi:bifunctional oligoribonuclease and PAP phosphatase NrnA